MADIVKIHFLSNSQQCMHANKNELGLHFCTCIMANINIVMLLIQHKLIELANTIRRELEYT